MSTVDAVNKLSDFSGLLNASAEHTLVKITLRNSQFIFVEPGIINGHDSPFWVLAPRYMPISVARKLQRFGSCFTAVVPDAYVGKQLVIAFAKAPFKKLDGVETPSDVVEIAKHTSGRATRSELYLLN